MALVWCRLAPVWLVMMGVVGPGWPNAAGNAFAEPGWAARPIGATYERDDIDRSAAQRHWAVVESSRCVSFNSVDPFSASSALQPGRFRLVPPPGGDEVPVKSVSMRALLMFAPLQWDDLRSAYRAFLHLAAPLAPGAEHSLLVAGLNTSWALQPITLPVAFDPSGLSENIRINQIGFPPDRPQKRAWLGQYAGSDARGTNVAVEFTAAVGIAPVFRVLDATTGRPVLSDRAATAAGQAAANMTGQGLWVLDFSDLSSTGWYRLEVSGVGVSHVFQVGPRVFDQISAAAHRGAYHARCGCGLTRNLTRFTRAQCHMHDGAVMPTDPLPPWFAAKFNLTSKDMFPERQRPPGTVTDAAGGHHDAGDYSKYTVSGSMFVGYTLLAYQNSTVAAKLRRDDGQIPEAQNGIPDILDELKWELDWLEGMADPSDGGAYCIVKPNGTVDGWYQKGMPDEPHNDDRVVLPKDTTCTGMLAGSMALAARSAVMRAHYPAVDTARWLAIAEAAWAFLVNNGDKPALCYQAYGCGVTTGPGSGCNRSGSDTDMSHHTRVWAASQLYLATGNATYHRYFLLEHCPHYRHYTWEPLPYGENSGGGYTLSTMAYGLERHSPGTTLRGAAVALDPDMAAACLDELRFAAEFRLNTTQPAFGLMMPDQAIRFRQYGWFFPQAISYTLLIAAAANAVDGRDQQIVQAVHTTWDYLLGANPGGHSLFTGFGAQRMRSIVDQDSVNDGIDPPVPGIPVGLASGPSWLGQYGRAEGVIWPAYATYPILAHQFDGFNVNREFTVQMLAFSMVTSSYFASTPAQMTTWGAEQNLAPVITAVHTNTTYGHVPLSAQFSVDAFDPNPGGYLSKVVWEFESVEDRSAQSQSQADRPVHTFRAPYRTQAVGVTVTSSFGKDTFMRSAPISTTPASYPFRPAPAVVDQHTMAILRPSTRADGMVLRNPHSAHDGPIAGVRTVTSGAPALDDSNLLWMANRSGFAVRFTDANDSLTFVLPARTFASGLGPMGGGTLSIALKLYVTGSGQGDGEPIGWGHKGNGFGRNILAGVYQSYERGFAWSAGEWDRPPDGASINLRSPAIPAHGKVDTILSAANLSNAMPFGAWYQLEFALTPHGSVFFVNGVALARSPYCTFFDPTATLNFTLGGFDGWVDDVALSNVTRAQRVRKQHRT